MLTSPLFSHFGQPRDVARTNLSLRKNLTASLTLLISLPVLIIGVIVLWLIHRPVESSVIATFIVCGAALAATVYAWRLALFLVRPLLQLKEQARKLLRDDDKVENPFDREDEFGQLAHQVFELGLDRNFRNRTLKYLTMHEPLTGLANRACLQMDLEDLIQDESGEDERCGLIFIDIDDFKELNDSYGYDQGDQALRTLADRISDTVLLCYVGDSENSPTIARVGGDEFAVLLPEMIDRNRLARLAETLSERIREPMVASNDQVFQMTASIGIACSPEEGKTFNELLNAADIALYNSKSLGKGTFRFYSSDMVKKDISALQIKSDFSEALANDGELELMYQPFFNLHTREIVGGEALMRWHHPELGTLEPSQFISVVEQAEIALQADLWVIENTIKLIDSLDLSVRENFVASANISASNLARDNFPGSVAKLLDASPIDPKHLQLEITETCIHPDEDKAGQTIHQLKALGLRVWLDDFGTGYSALQHLPQFPIDGIKIDRQFVVKMQSSEGEKMLVSAMLSLARSFGLSALAEGIDNEKDCQILMDLGCKIGQGMLFSEPVKDERFLEMLQAPKKTEAELEPA